MWVWLRRTIGGKRGEYAGMRSDGSCKVEFEMISTCKLAGNGMWIGVVKLINLAEKYMSSG
jgi:hypothetical protein